MDKKKILFVITALEAGGAEKSLVNLLNLFDYQKYQVDLLLFKKQGAFLQQVPGEVNIITGSEIIKGLYNNPVLKLTGLERLQVTFARIIGAYYKIRYKNKRGIGNQLRWHKVYRKLVPKESGHYDIAVAYMHYEPIYFVAEKINADRKIGWVHNDYSSIDCIRNIDREYFSAFDKLVSISDECVHNLIKEFPDLEDHFVMMPNITSADVIKKLSWAYSPSEYETMNSEVLKIISIGRLHEQKGFDIALEALALIKKRGIFFKWFVIGKGELKEELLKQINRLELEDEVELLGIRSNPYPYLKNADIVLQPSRFEGKSVVLDEAKILSKPIVVTNYSTVQDQIINEKEGIVVDLSVEGVYKGLERILCDSELREQLSNYLGRHNYDNAFEIDRYYELFNNSSFI